MRAFAVIPWWLLVLASVAAAVPAQAPGVPVYEDSEGDEPSREEKALQQAALLLKEAGKLLPGNVVKEQLARTKCALVLPPAATKPLRGPEAWRRARSAYVRVGHLYQCKHCSDWHLNLAGGYAIAADGIVATCHHVVLPDDRDMKEAWLVCADDDGHVFPVHEVLAADARTDVAILRTGARKAEPLPLRVDVVPGETCWVFSDPMGARGVFSTGIVHRFVQASPLDGGGERVVVVEVGADWAPGSSGSAVLDECGNAIGHVASIKAQLEEPEDAGEPAAAGDVAPPVPLATYLVQHAATRAADVLRLIEVLPAKPVESAKPVAPAKREPANAPR